MELKAPHLTPPRVLRALAARLGAGPGFEVWAAAEPGAPRHAEATGLRWQAALTAAARHRRWCRRMPRSPGGGGGSAGRGCSCPAGVRSTREVAKLQCADRIGAG